MKLAFTRPPRKSPLLPAMPFVQHRTPGATEIARLDTASLRSAFLLGGLFTPGEMKLVSTDLDRAVVGGACPAPGAALELSGSEALRSAFFCERRELGVLNLGEAGTVEVDGAAFALGKLECLYIGRGSRDIRFVTGAAGRAPAFYLVSYPAHATHPTTKATRAEANVLELGAPADANRRTLVQLIHEGGIRSCQLVMGYTELAQGSVWNTMPPHTHDRRSEVYCYFDLPANHAVLHLMGEPRETRPLWVGEREVVLSPPWSIHCGCGTNAYRFVWAMGGENQRFDDMDRVALRDLR